MKMNLIIVLLVVLLSLNIVHGIKISNTKDKKNLNNANDKLKNQAGIKEKVSIQATTAEKSTLKPVDKIKNEKSEEEMYELERANAMAEMIF